MWNQSTCGESLDFSSSVMYRNLKFLHMTDFFSTDTVLVSVTNMRYEQNGVYLYAVDMYCILCICLYARHTAHPRESVNFARQDFAKTEWDEVSAVPVYMTANSPQTASTREAIREKRPISGFVSPVLIQSVWLKVFKIDVTKFIAIFNNLIPLNSQ